MSYPCRAPGLRIHPARGGAMLRHPARGRLHQLNATATLIVELCDGTRTIDDIVGLVQRAWTLPTPPATEVHGLIERLVGEGALVLREDPLTVDLSYQPVMRRIKPYFLELLDVLTDAKVPYWADGGTPLGAIREVTAPFWRRNARRFRLDASAGFVAHTAVRWRDAVEGRFTYPASLFAPLRTTRFYDRRIAVPRRAAAFLKGCHGEECLRRAALSAYDSDGPRITDFAPL